jgi:uncharacterized protein Usg
MHRELDLRMRGYGLTTAEILYHMPDHPHLLQTFVWQQYDLAPDFPEMMNFLDFWRRSLDGALHSVRYVHNRLITPTEWRALRGELILH